MSTTILHDISWVKGFFPLGTVMGLTKLEMHGNFRPNLSNPVLAKHGVLVAGCMVFIEGFNTCLRLSFVPSLFFQCLLHVIKMSVYLLHNVCNLSFTCVWIFASVCLLSHGK